MAIRRFKHGEKPRETGDGVKVQGIRESEALRFNVTPPPESSLLSVQWKADDVNIPGATSAQSPLIDDSYRGKNISVQYTVQMAKLIYRVPALNRNPVVVGDLDFGTLYLEQGFILTAEMLRSGVTDPDSDVVNVSGFSSIVNGVVSGTGPWVITPQETGAGSVIITYSDGRGGVATRNAIWTVVPAPPVSGPLPPSYADWIGANERYGYLGAMAVGVNSPDGFELGRVAFSRPLDAWSISGDVAGLSIRSDGMITVSNAASITTAAIRYVTVRRDYMGTSEEITIPIRVVDAAGPNMFVDEVSGNDANSGREPHIPKKTLDNAVTLFSNSRTNTFLRRGVEFTGPLQYRTGRTYRSYGDPMLPNPKVNFSNATGMNHAIQPVFSSGNFTATDGWTIEDIDASGGVVTMVIRGAYLFTVKRVCLSDNVEDANSSGIRMFDTRGGGVLRFISSKNLYGDAIYGTLCRRGHANYEIGYCNFDPPAGAGADSIQFTHEGESSQTNYDVWIHHCVGKQNPLSTNLKGSVAIEGTENYLIEDCLFDGKYFAIGANGHKGTIRRITVPGGGLPSSNGNYTNTWGLGVGAQFLASRLSFYDNVINGQGIPGVGIFNGIFISGYNLSGLNAERWDIEANNNLIRGVARSIKTVMPWSGGIRYNTATGNDTDTVVNQGSVATQGSGAQILLENFRPSTLPETAGAAQINGTVEEGHTVTVTSNRAIASCYWRLNGIPIPGATSTSFTIPNGYASAIDERKPTFGNLNVPELSCVVIHTDGSTSAPVVTNIALYGTTPLHAALTKPSELAWFPYNVFANNTTDYHPDLFRPTGKTYYISPTGSDANTGLTPDVPMKTVLAAANKTDCVVVVAEPGDYENGYWGDTSFQNNFRGLICDGPGRARFHAGPLNVGSNFVPDAENPGAYKWAASGNALDCRDEAWPTVWGHAGWMTKLTSAASVAATPNSFYSDGTSLWVRLRDDRVPDNRLRVFKTRRSYIGKSNVDLYWKGLDFVGGNILPHPSGTNIRNHLYQCDIAYGNGLDDAILLTNGVNAGFITYCTEVKAYGTRLDCFSLQGSAKGVYLNCEGFDAPMAGSNNANTMHGSASAILIGGNYHDVAGDVVISVSSGGVLCLGVISRDCPGTSASDFSSTVGPMWLVNCTNRDSISDYTAEGNGAKNVQNNDFTLGSINAALTPVTLYSGPGIIPSVPVAPVINSALVLDTLMLGDSVVLTEEDLMVGSTGGEFVIEVTATNATVAGDGFGPWTVTPTAEGSVTVSYTISNRYGKYVNRQATMAVGSSVDLTAVTKMVFFGASLTYGMIRGANGTEDFTPGMVEYVKSKYGKDVTIVNAGVNGDNVDALTTRLPALLASHAGPTTLWVFDGLVGNDVSATRPWTNLDATAQNTLRNKVRAICQSVKDAGCPIAFANASWRNYGLDGSCVTNEALGSKPYNDNIVNALAAEFSPQFFDSVNGRPRLDFYTQTLNTYTKVLKTTDGVHRTSPGYAEMRSYFLKTICDIIYLGQTPSAVTRRADPSAPFASGGHTIFRFTGSAGVPGNSQTLLGYGWVGNSAVSNFKFFGREGLTDLTISHTGRTGNSQSSTAPAVGGFSLLNTALLANSIYGDTGATVDALSLGTFQAGVELEIGFLSARITTANTYISEFSVDGGATWVSINSKISASQPGVPQFTTVVSTGAPIVIKARAGAGSAYWCLNALSVRQIN